MTPRFALVSLIPILSLQGIVQCHHWPTQQVHSSNGLYLSNRHSRTLHSPNGTHSSTEAAIPILTTVVPTTSPLAIKTVSSNASYSSSSAGVGDAVLSSSNTTCGNLIIPVIVLSILLGILLFVLMCLLLFLCRWHRHRKGFYGHPQDGPAHAPSVRPMVISNIPVIDSKILPSDTPATPPANDQTLAQTADAPRTRPTSIYQSSAEQAPAPISPRTSRPLASENCHDTTFSVAALAPHAGAGEEAASGLRSVAAERSIKALDVADVDGFSQGQDVEFHPEVRELLEKGNLTKDAVVHMVPMKPKAETVNPGYNPKLDEKRPDNMRDYLMNYRILFVIDDSGSMSGPHWKETRSALFEIADYALNYHSDAVDIQFFNDSHQGRGVKGSDEVINVFNRVRPGGGTPTGQVLEKVLKEQIDRLDMARRDKTSVSERPLDIIVLTDGVPDYDSPPAPVIEAAAGRLREKKHHPNSIGIQFVQIGNDPQAEPTLLSLVEGPNNDMVDTISYSLYADQEPSGELTAAVLERIILGALHPNLRAYWNQYRKKTSTNAPNAF